MSSEESDDTEETFAQQSPENLDNLGGDLVALFQEDELSTSKVEELSIRTNLTLSKIPVHLRSIVDDCDLILSCSFILISS